MPTNSFAVTKTTKYNQLIVIEQELSGKVNHTNEFTMELPAGSGHRFVSAQATLTANAAATNTQVARVEKVSTAGAATAIATFAGTLFNAASAGFTAPAGLIDASELDIDAGESIRFALDWGAADTGTMRIVCLLTAN